MRTSAASGSAHHQPKSRLNNKPRQQCEGHIRAGDTTYGICFEGCTANLLCHSEFPLPQKGHNTCCCHCQPNAPPGRFWSTLCQQAESTIGHNVDGKSK